MTEGFQKINVKLTGVAPLLMHNNRLVDPLDSFTKAMKAISSKRKKTDEDHERLSWLEWHGGLYTTPGLEAGKGGDIVGADTALPTLTGDMLEACTVAGAKVARLGKDFASGYFVDQVEKFDYDGPKKLAGLQTDKAFWDRRQARVQTSTVMRTRPRFERWSVEFSAYFLTDVLQFDQVEKALRDAGRLKGIGDWHPRYGRFDVSSIKEVA